MFRFRRRWAGLAALNEDAYVKEARELIGKERAWMKAELEKAGLTVWDSCANYLFFEGPKGLAARLEKGGILIRDCSNYLALPTDITVQPYVHMKKTRF